MSDDTQPLSWQDIALTAALVCLITVAGCGAAFAAWLSDLYSPQIAILGSGDHLSILVVDGPARLLIANGDDPVAFENAISQVRPMFARRIDVLLVAGSGASLLAPIAANDARHVRSTFPLATLPASPEAEAFGPVQALPGPRRITIGPSLAVTVETRFPFGADPSADFPAWRAIIERGETRVVVLSDGAAGGLFSPVTAASALIVAGDDPSAGWRFSPTPALVTNAEAIDGPDLRTVFDGLSRPPQWGFLVFPGEALRMRFVPEGIAIPSQSAHRLGRKPRRASQRRA